MKVSLMTYEGTLHKDNVEWGGKTEHNGMYARFPGEEHDHFTTALLIRPEDVEEYVARCEEYKEKISQLQHELIQFKTMVHHRLIPFK